MPVTALNKTVEDRNGEGNAKNTVVAADQPIQRVLSGRYGSFCNGRRRDR